MLVIVSALGLLHLAAGELLLVLAAVAYLLIAVYVVVHLILPFEITSKG